MAELEPGHVIGPWIIEKVLGSGAFGITYLAHHHTSELRAFKKAIKECYPSGVVSRRESGSISVSARGRAMFEEELRYFREEAQALARISHKNVVKMTDFIEANGTCYLVTDYVAGPTLRQRVGSPRSGQQNLLECAQVRSLLTTMLDALEAVHVHLVHRDIDPQNIVLEEQTGAPVLIDFGAARTLSAAKSHTLTAILKHGYAPYEQYTLSDDEFEEEFGEAPAGLTRQLPEQGPWTDLYALAATCHFALTGKAPPNALNRKLGLKEYEPLADRIEGDELLLRSIDKALSVEPADRFQSAAEWRVALASAKPMSPPPPPPPTPPPSPEKEPGNRLVPLLAGVGVVAILGIAIAMNGGSGSGAIEEPAAEDAMAVAEEPACQAISYFALRKANVRLAPAGTAEVAGSLARAEMVSGCLVPDAGGSDKQWLAVDSGPHAGGYVSQVNLALGAPPVPDREIAGTFYTITPSSVLAQPSPQADTLDFNTHGHSYEVLASVGEYAEVGLKDGGVGYVEWSAFGGIGGEGYARQLYVVNSCSAPITFALPYDRSGNWLVDAPVWDYSGGQQSYPSIGGTLPANRIWLRNTQIFFYQFEGRFASSSSLRALSADTAYVDGTPVKLRRAVLVLNANDDLVLTFDCGR